MKLYIKEFCKIPNYVPLSDGYNYRGRLNCNYPIQQDIKWWSSQLDSAFSNRNLYSSSVIVVDSMGSL